MTNSAIDTAGLEVGKIYMVSPNSDRSRYWLYYTDKDVVINRSEPFLVIRSEYLDYQWLVVVCNSSGEVGMIDPSDVAGDKAPAFVLYVSEQ